ncbi:hypothetical protein LN042_21035 [Kitasatospora sp. RB6PN24]|uniref:hypothetical protein n=1 Tax=Kitasatospora humi TaxID=2893891 RepID=UPI001E3E05DC|nr:hypothetical protein [Kitasatospora humi]MCC9309531.1 hypothetical protein [Kitasatospora humi]
MIRSYRAELLRSTSRGTTWFLAFCFALMVFSMSNAGPQHQSPLWGFRQAGIVVATLLMGRAATAAAGDFSSGTIRAWLISVPSRLRLGLGKLAASASIAAGFAVLAGAAGYAVSGLFGRMPGVGDMAAATAELLGACVILSVFGHATGLLTRSVPAALTVSLAWILAAEHVLEGRFAHSTQWLPGLVTQRLTQHKLTVEALPGALAHALLPFVLLDGLALLLFVRRDVTS